MINDDEILKQAHERFDLCVTAWGHMHQKNNEILKFIAGDQWTEMARSNLENAGFSAQTQDMIKPALRQITNELRKNTPSIQVNPADDTTVKSAGKMDDLVRSIQEACKADVAYQQGGLAAAQVGMGFLRVLSKYESNDSMNQVLYVEPVYDANTVMLDPNHRGVAGQDSEYAFVTTTLTLDEYGRRYGGSKLDEMIKAKSWVGARKNWIEGDMVVINEYYFKDYDKKTLYQIRFVTTGKVDTTFDLSQYYVLTEDGMIDGELPQEEMLTHPDLVMVIDQRNVQVPTIRWCKLNEVEVLEKSVWPGDYIPIVAVKADEFWIDDKRRVVGAVEPAIEAQVSLNYYLSLEAQYIQMAPKAPYIGTAAQFKTFEQQWAALNVSSQAFIPYNKDDNAPPPSRDLGEVPIQRLAELVADARNAVRQIFGVFDPTNTQIAPESGKALLARQHQAYNSNFHFYDNLARSVQHVGCILIDAIPTFYDTPRRIQTINEAGEQKTVDFNTPDESGKVAYDLTNGSYTVSIQTGPSFGTKRQEGASQLLELMKVLSPEASQALADMAVSNMDWPGAKEAAARLRAMVPIEILQASDAEEGVDSAEDAARLKAMVTQLKQQLEKVQQAFVQQQQMLDIANQEMKLEKMSKEVDMLKAELDYKLKSRDQDVKEATTELEFYIKQKELEMQQQELDLKKAQMAVAGIKVASEMNHRDLEASERQTTLEKKLTDAGTDVGIGIPKLKTDIMPDSSIDNDMGNTLNTTLE
jgi:hypothetical protein